MRFLLDTNCWMQIARERPYAQDVHALLSAVPPADVFVTDFAVHSVGVVLLRHKAVQAFPAFVREMGIGERIGIVRLAPADYARVADACQAHRLDFDDAYQYAAAELHDLTLVSLDADFDRTPRGRLTPAAALAAYAAAGP